MINAAVFDKEVKKNSASCLMIFSENLGSRKSKKEPYRTVTDPKFFWENHGETNCLIAYPE